jgi:hypothetical protein
VIVYYCSPVSLHSVAQYARPLIDEWRLDVGAQLAHVVGATMARALTQRASDVERGVRHWLAAPLFRCAAATSLDVSHASLARRVADYVDDGAPLLDWILSLSNR